MEMKVKVKMKVKMVAEERSKSVCLFKGGVLIGL
jgi:hypothetical protein